MSKNTETEQGAGSNAAAEPQPGEIATTSIRRKPGRPKSPIPIEERRRIYRAKLLAKNPNYYTKYVNQWREKNPERARELMYKANAKATSRRRAKRVLERAYFYAGPIRKIIEQKVAHHITRGRDLGTIIGWMEMPQSVLQPVYDRLTKAKSQ